MKHREGFTLIELMVVIVIIGILATIAIANYVNMKTHAQEAQVKSDVHSVQLAVEDYAVSNEGLYSAAQADLQPLLPGGQLLVNAFTKGQTEPQFGAAAIQPGEVGVEVVLVAGMPSGYTVTGFGKTQVIIEMNGGH